MNKEAAYKRVVSYWNSVRVLLPDPVSLRLPLLCNTRHDILSVQLCNLNKKLNCLAGK
jgi:hypothetical protein